MKDRVVVQVEMTAQQKQQLREEAGRRGQTMSGLIKTWISRAAQRAAK